MKKLLLALFIFTACEDEPDLTSIEVVESVSNLPVSDATVVLFRCNYGCLFGPHIFFTGVTDSKGICKVPTENYTDVESQLNVMKTNYWPFAVQKNTMVFLVPEGWVQLRIQREVNYPAGSKLLLTIHGQSGSMLDITEYNTVVDSLILIKGFGGQQNKIDWQVVDGSFNLLKNGTLDSLQIPRLDTLKNVILDYY